MNRNILSARLWLVLEIALIASGSLAFASTSRIDQRLKLGRQSLAARDYNKAALAFEGADRAADGGSWFARIGLTRTYLAMGRYREALSQGRQALILSADAKQQAESHFEIGRCYYLGWPRMDLQQQAAMNRASEELSLATELLSELGLQSLGMQAAALFQMGDRDKAEELLVKSKSSGTKIAGLAADINCFLGAGKRFEVFRPDVKGDHGPKVSKPKLRRPPRPIYPESGRVNGEQGLVVLEVLVSQQGLVECARVLKGLPYGLTEAALVAAKRAKYEPALKDGEPVAVYFKAAVSFFIQ